ncbi:hypothetical protein LXL04_017255 [Taraxacum kok-saghyz]
MLLPGTPFIRNSPVNHHYRKLFLVTNSVKKPIVLPLATIRCHGVGNRIFIATAAAAVVILSSTTPAIAIAPRNPPPDAAETLSNIPQMLSGDCVQGKDGDCKKARIQKPKSRQAESCTRKCVTTCIRGGDGSPGEGPLNLRRPLTMGLRCSFLMEFIIQGNQIQSSSYFLKLVSHGTEFHPGFEESTELNDLLNTSKIKP